MHAVLRPPKRKIRKIREILEIRNVKFATGIQPDRRRARNTRNSKREIRYRDTAGPAPREKYEKFENSCKTQQFDLPGYCRTCRATTGPAPREKYEKFEALAGLLCFFLLFLLVISCGPTCIPPASGASGPLKVCQATSRGLLTCPPLPPPLVLLHD